MATLQEFAEEYSERLRMCEPEERNDEVARIAKEIQVLNRSGTPISRTERLELIELIENDAEGKPQKVKKAHDMTSFHQAIAMLRQQLSGSK
ncbi:hypothetical protein [Sorangium sp. So ce1151]|uniref:hypothetical protein n=1 Tax=Sorangium sp. So ce1151 TaxID=3133332 RepID=UPI003F625E6F